MQQIHNQKRKLLLALCLFSAAITVSAQGWGSGARVSRSNSPAKARESSKKEVSTAKQTQASKIALKNSPTGKLQQQAAKTSGGSNGTKSVAAKTGRERRVTESKGTGNSDSTAVGSVKASEVKNAESVRIGYASA